MLQSEGFIPNILGKSRGDRQTQGDEHIDRQLLI